jgi:hypothetical protein
VNTAEWLMAIDAHPDTLDTDLVVAVALANGESTVDGLHQELVDDSIEEAIAYARRGRGKRKRPSSGWESLTPTQKNVTLRVTDGLTNKEIAAQLLISPNGSDPPDPHLHQARGHLASATRARSSTSHLNYRTRATRHPQRRGHTTDARARFRSPADGLFSQGDARN